MSLGTCIGAIKMYQRGDGDFVRRAQQGEDSSHLNGGVAGSSDGAGIRFRLKGNSCVLFDHQDVLVHFLVATGIARLAAPGEHDYRTRHLRAAAVKFNRSGLDMKGAVDELVGCLERDLDLTALGVDDEGLMLGERGRSEYHSEGEGCEGFHFISPRRSSCGLAWPILACDCMWSSDGGLGD